MGRRSINYTKEELIAAVASSKSKREVLIKLGLVGAGGNYATLNQAIDQFDLDVSHMTGCSHAKGKTLGPKRPIEDYLENKVGINSSRLRVRLIDEGLFDHMCMNCGLTEWQHAPAPLELDHIDGNHMDNRLDNLRLLCPNCHAQTPTYRRRKDSL